MATTDVHTEVALESTSLSFRRSGLITVLQPNVLIIGQRPHCIRLMTCKKVEDCWNPYHQESSLYSWTHIFKESVQAGGLGPDSMSYRCRKSDVIDKPFLYCLIFKMRFPIPMRHLYIASGPCPLCLTPHQVFVKDMKSGLAFLKTITCPTPRILKFFDLLIWSKEEKFVQILLPDW